MNLIYDKNAFQVTVEFISMFCIIRMVMQPLPWLGGGDKRPGPKMRFLEANGHEMVFSIEPVTYVSKEFIPTLIIFATDIG